MALFRNCRPQSRAGRTNLVPGGLACAAGARRFALSTFVLRKTSANATLTGGQISALTPMPPAPPAVG